MRWCKPFNGAITRNLSSNYIDQLLLTQLSERLLNEFGNSRILFKPEAVPVKDRVSAIQRFTQGQGQVFEGQSGMDLLEAEDLPRAKDIHAGISRLIAFQPSLDAYVAVEKYLLVRQGICSSARQCGPDGVTLSTETKQSIDKVFEDLVNTVAG